jgi:hypothetical protein
MLTCNVQLSNLCKELNQVLGSFGEDVPSQPVSRKYPIVRRDQAVHLLPIMLGHLSGVLDEVDSVLTIGKSMANDGIVSSICRIG